jgi:hypothetical protein
MSRPARTEEVQVQRRRRQGTGADSGYKLNVPGSLKDKDFVNDRPGRVQQLTVQDDWEKVPFVTEQNAGEGTVETRVVDKTVGDRAVLLRKPKKFYDSDKLEEQKVLDARDEAMRHAPPSSPEGLSGPESYVPGGRNIVNGR